MVCSLLVWTSQNWDRGESFKPPETMSDSIKAIKGLFGSMEKVRKVVELAFLKVTDDRCCFETNLEISIALTIEEENLSNIAKSSADCLFQFKV